jgi:hypothetical protein
MGTALVKGQHDTTYKNARKCPGRSKLRENYGKMMEIMGKKQVKNTRNG